MVKKKKEKAILKEPKSRAKYKCPEKLERLLEMTNNFHPEGLLDISQYSERVKQNLSDEKYKSLTLDEMFKLEAIEISKDLGKRAGWFVLGNLKQAWAHVGRLPEGNTTDDIFPPDVGLAFIGGYVNLKSDIDNLTDFARALNDVRKGRRTSSSIKSERFSATLVPAISENGKVKIRMTTSFFDAVDEIAADRLRICEICNRIFWAKREESETCSSPCFNNLRVRRYRNLTPEEKAERNAKREANRRINKKLKERRKNNGTV